MSLRVAAVVLNYRTPDDTLIAVRSLRASTHPLHQIVVVDNGSGDDSVRRLGDLAEVTLVALPSNEGFSGGCNAGIRTALSGSPDGVFLVNSDVFVPPATVGTLAGLLAVQPSIGIAGPAVRVRSRPDVVESLGVSYRPGSGRMRMHAHGRAARLVPPFDHRIVDAVTGCAMLVRREVFGAAGLLSEEYFFGFEDVEFCLRAREHGFLSACSGRAFVLHEGQRSIGRRSSQRTYFATRNHLLLASRYPGGSSRLARTGRLVTVTGLNLARALAAADVPRLAAVRGCVAGAWDFVAGRFGRP